MERLCCILLLFSGAATVKIRRLGVPDAVRAGQEVVLTCDYDLEHQTLRTVKWYKGSYEFYRYQPQSYHETKKFFPLQKLYLNERECDDHRVILRDVHADMSGYYKCEVTTSEMYETDEKRQYLLVVQPPSVPPEIRGVPADGVSRGDWLKVQCHLPWMNVKPQLEFYVNGRHASHMNDITRHTILKENVKGRRRLRPVEYSLVSVDGSHYEDEDGVWEDGGTTTMLEFPVKKKHVNDGRVEIKCKASASNGLYESETVVNVPVIRYKT